MANFDLDVYPVSNCSESREKVILEKGRVNYANTSSTPNNRTSLPIPRASLIYTTYLHGLWFFYCPKFELQMSRVL